MLELKDRQDTKPGHIVWTQRYLIWKNAGLSSTEYKFPFSWNDIKYFYLVVMATSDTISDIYASIVPPNDVVQSHDVQMHDLFLGLGIV